MRVAGLVLMFGALATAPRAAAQGTADSTTSCDGRIVSSIHITPHPAALIAVPRRLHGIARAIGVIHTTTKAAVVRRFLLLEPGRPCTERMRAESERILRLQPFLADATVRGVDDGSGGVRIEVETVDDIATVLGGSFDGWLPSALTLGDGNVDGQGIYVAAHVERGYAYRSGRSLRVVDYQTFGRPYTFAFVAERAPLGSTLTLALGHAFLTDLQRTAWHAGYMDVSDFASYARPEGAALSAGLDRSFWDVGQVIRIGGRGPTAFAGGLLTHERSTPSAQAVVISDSGFVVDADTTLEGRFPSYSNFRVNAVAGVRAMTFVTVRGFDALTAAQDVASGVQLGVLLGRGVPRFGASDNDIFLAGDLYAGIGSERSLLAVRMEGEGRQDRESRRWDSMVASGRLAWYRKFAAAHLLIASTEFSGGWRERVPFQLTLGDGQGGVRGYHGSRVGGGQRMVVRLEERWSIGQVTHHIDVGVAAYSDAGKIWRGDVPYGVTSPVRTSVGVGLLAAFPHSKQLWRLDLAVPTSVDANAHRWELRLSSTRVRGFWREPRDIARVRAGAAPSAIFTWP